MTTLPRKTLGPPGTEKFEREDRVIGQLLAALAAWEGPLSMPPEWPDRPGPAQVEKGCDCIAARPGGLCAIEHTRIHSFQGRPGHIARTMVLRAAVRDAVLSLLPDDRIHLVIALDELPVRFRPRDLAARIAEDAAAVAAKLGQDRREQVQVAYTSSPMVVEKHKRWPGTTGACHVIMFGSSAEEVAADIVRAMSDKALKMTLYKSSGHSTLLLLDAPEAIGYPMQFGEAFRLAAERVNHGPFDEIVIGASVADPVAFHLVKHAGRLWEVREDGVASFLKAQFEDQQSRLGETWLSE